MAFEDQSLGEVLKLQDFPVEQKTEYVDLINLQINRESEFLRWARKIPLNENRTSITYPIVIVPEVDKNGNMYKYGLAEGYSPTPETFEEIEITKDVKDYGWTYTFTKKWIKRSFRDVWSKLVNNLKILERKFIDEKLADAMLSSLNTVSGTIDLCKEADVDKLHTILSDNDAQPIDGDGNYGLIVNDQLARAMKRKYGELITHTSEKEAPIKGEIGVFSGFRIIVSKTVAFRPTAATTSPFVAFGLGADGQLPLGTVDPEGTTDLIVKDYGTVKEGDYLNKIGAISISLDGVNYWVINDSVVLHGISTTTGENYVSTSNKFDFATLLGELNKTSSEIFPNVQSLELGGDGEFTINVRDKTGADVTASCAFASSDTAVVSVGAATGVLTPVKKGKAIITITKSSLTTYVPVEITSDPTE